MGGLPEMNIIILIKQLICRHEFIYQAYPKLHLICMKCDKRTRGFN